MTPERLEELRERARRLESDLRWLADELAYFAVNASDPATAQDMMNWVPLRVWTLLTDRSAADKQCSRIAPLSLTGDECFAGVAEDLTAGSVPASSHNLGQNSTWSEP